jgi:mRNA-degrading endonuclease RelE of RelBE toxin-antitoxin system
MSTEEILAELPKLSREDRRRILDRILEMEDEAESIEAIRRTADEGFQHP